MHQVNFFWPILIVFLYPYIILNPTSTHFSFSDLNIFQGNYIYKKNIIRKINLLRMLLVGDQADVHIRVKSR